MIGIDSFRKTQAVCVYIYMFLYNEGSSTNKIYSGIQKASGQGAALLPSPVYSSVSVLACRQGPADQGSYG